MRVTLELGRAFAREAGFAKRELALAPPATAADLLRAAAREAPGLSCLDEAGTSVDLGAANLSVNGKAVDPRHPEAFALGPGDRCYLYGVLSGG